MSRNICVLVWLRKEEYCGWLFYAVPTLGATKGKQEFKFSLYRQWRKVGIVSFCMVANRYFSATKQGIVMPDPYWWQY